MQLFNIKVRGSEQVLTLRQVPVLRQAFVVAGSIVWIGVALAFWVHINFLLVPLFVGGGLLFSGLAGVCPMVAILNLLPWNRSTSATK